MIGERSNEDSLAFGRGRPLRDVAFVVTTNQNFDQFTASDAYRDARGQIGCFLGFLGWLSGAPWVLYGLPFLYGAYRFSMRGWAFAPTLREAGARHCVVIFAESGFWHRAEYIRGKGEVVSVLTDMHGPVPARLSSGFREMIARARWGDESTIDQPREATRVVRTYRRRRSGFLPFEFYARTSAGFACHVLGVTDRRIRTPRQLADWCEREGAEDEAGRSDVLQGA